MSLYRLDHRCGCGRYPNWRAFPRAREMYDQWDDDEPMHTWRCACGEVNLLTAAAFKYATPAQKAA